MPRPIKAIVDLSALRSNLALAKRVAPGARMLAVVKANAYGHGVLNAARAFENADGFAILEIENAVRLRDAGCRQPIVLLEGAFDSHDLRAAAEHRLACAIHDRDQVRLLQDLPAAARLDLFVKLNTGMNRLGIAPRALPGVLDTLRAEPRARSVTLMTHFACADDERGVAEQWERFEAATRHRA